ncbi:MAG: hypothetical protein FWB80_03230 [Defluviitaleaceae bacterium]|nr:hypothetical protein [Defluviitaleaceae bacterium]
MNPLHTFELSGAKGGLMGMFGGKPTLGITDNGFVFTEGKDKKEISFSAVKELKFSKYYSVVTIVHSEIKKFTLVNVGMFETIWSDFARKKGLTIKLKAE